MEYDKYIYTNSLPANKCMRANCFDYKINEIVKSFLMYQEVQVLVQVVLLHFQEFQVFFV